MYANSKLLVQYCTLEIAKLALGPDGTYVISNANTESGIDKDRRPQVIVNPMCPGMVKSELGRDYRSNALMGLLVDGFMNFAMKSTEGGAIIPVLAALTTREENGKHFSDQPYEDYRL